jgi:hypothetical protein
MLRCLLDCFIGLCQSLIALSQQHCYSVLPAVLCTLQRLAGCMMSLEVPCTDLADRDALCWLYTDTPLAEQEAT